MIRASMAPMGATGSRAQYVRAALLAGTALNRLTLTRSSGGSAVSAAGAITIYSNDVPRIDYDPTTLLLRGLLVEDQRTNGIRNPRGEGAVVGSPGTLPTNWQTFNLPDGLAVSVASTGVEDGLPYVDLRLFGTPTSSNPSSPTAGFACEGTTSVSGASGERFTASVYMRVVAGDLGGLTWWLMSQERSTNLPDDRVSFTPTSAPLRQQRVAVTHTIIASSNMWSPIRFAGYTAGVPVDVTLRVAGNQLEKGDAASSLILPPAGAPAASTRAADLLSMTGADPQRGTIIVKWRDPFAGPYPSNRGIVEFGDGSAGNRLLVFVPSGGTYIDNRCNRDGVSTNAGTIGGLVSGGRNAAALTWGTSRVGHALNGVAKSRDDAVLPDPSRMILGPTLFGGGNGVSAYPVIVESIVYIPRTLTDAELVAATTP